MAVYPAIPDGTDWVKDHGSEAIDSWVSDGTIHTVKGSLVAGAEYVIIEEEAPYGYKLSKAEHFTCPAAGTPGLYTMVNSITYRAGDETRITKTDEHGDRIGGAKLQVIAKDRTVVAEWVSSSSAIKVFGKELFEGETYTLHEVYAPTGYSLAPDKAFTL